MLGWISGVLDDFKGRNRSMEWMDSLDVESWATRHNCVLQSEIMWVKNKFNFSLIYGHLLVSCI